MTVVTRHLSKCVKLFFCFLFFVFCCSWRQCPPLRIHKISNARSHGCNDDVAQWWASLNECGQIFGFVIGNAIFPTTEQDAQAFESQCFHRCVVIAVPISLLLVVGSSPPGLRNRVTGPFVKTLPQKLRTGPAEMYPFPFPTLLPHRCDPAVSLHFVGTAITIPLSQRQPTGAAPALHPLPPTTRR
jgi:hypothetical protein